MGNTIDAPVRFEVENINTGKVYCYDTIEDAERAIASLREDREFAEFVLYGVYEY